MRRLLYGTAVILFTAFSLGLKIPGALAPTQAEAGLTTELPHSLSSYFDRTGFTRTHSHTITQGGVYVAQVYQSNMCNGWFAVLRLNRNAEGAHLLHAVFNPTDPNIAYIVDNTRFDKFPEILFAWNRLIQTLYGYVGIRQDLSNTQAWAIATTGTCEPFTLQKTHQWASPTR